jgi:predicted RNase H-like HicB family nuclease
VCWTDQVTQGDTPEEALALAQDAIQGYLEALAKDGLPIPEEREPPRLVMVRVAA